MLLPSTLVALSLVATVAFTDVPRDAWYFDSVQLAADMGIVSGYKDESGQPLGEFRPRNPVTMAEALKIAVEGAGYDYRAYPEIYFGDPNWHWVSPYYRVAMAEHFAFFVGADEHVQNSATRREVARVICDAFFPKQREEIVAGTYDNPYDDIELWGTPDAFILKLTEDGILTGDTDANGNPTGHFRPNDLISRAEMAAVVMRARATYNVPGQGRP